MDLSYFEFVFAIALSVSCSLVIICWEKADFLPFLYLMCFCVFDTFPYRILGQVWYLIVSIPDFVAQINRYTYSVCWLTRIQLLAFISSSVHVAM